MSAMGKGDSARAANRFDSKGDGVSCSFPPIVDDQAQVLILGTMPGKMSLEKSLYYAHPRNDFWRIIYGVFGKEPDPDYNRRVQFLKEHRIALWDVLAQCKREGSSDFSIREERPNGILQWLRGYPGIRAVLFNGQPAEGFYRRFFPKLPRLRYLTLPSTSPANPSPTKMERWSILRELLKLPPLPPAGERGGGEG
ncbi:MAG: DNA-deoxyinosine glycosylase [Deltaproteobacteria bacterium]|nr:DNA-deoxyinosine glycosylase [Deltaproteobacteria bacterium]